MHESTKTNRYWGELENSVLQGKGIDIGCGPDPVRPGVVPFDLEHGDANEITKFINDQFDFVYASHCLEHMHEPRRAVLEWWKLVKPGGYLFFIVPDEDLYEQGVFPSRFNPDHKATFTVSKAKSWSPVSINVLDLASSLPCGKLVSLKLQDQNYDRSRMTHGVPNPSRSTWRLLHYYESVKKWTRLTYTPLEELRARLTPLDQTLNPDAVGQIQCIVQKLKLVD